MARPLRIEFPGAVYHVTSRSNERRPVFFSDDDRIAFLDFLGEATKRFGWSVTVWVLMTNHFHLVIQTPEANLSRGMQLAERYLRRLVQPAAQALGPSLRRSL
jgi:REP element-mobilizing transposase RayT